MGCLTSTRYPTSRSSAYLCILAVTFALLLVACASSPRRGVDHVVRPGENLYRISRYYGVTVDSIVRANRIRTLLMQQMEEAISGIDVYLSPSWVGDNLLLTNLTGHPSVVLPNGFRSGDGTPTSITFCGRLHGDAEVLALARAYQQATDFHLRRPPLGA